jgi:predicted nucleic acid-binding protein
MGVALLDSSAVIGYLDETDALHPSAVAEIESALRAGGTLAISAVTWSETLHGALLGHLPEGELRELIADFTIDVLAIDAEVAEQAALLQSAYRRTGRHRVRPKLRTPDALILATSLVRADIDRIICGDERWTKVPGVTAELVLLRT